MIRSLLITLFLGAYSLAATALTPCDINLTVPNTPTVNILFYGEGIDAHKVLRNEISYWFDQSFVGILAGVLTIVLFVLPLVATMYRKKTLSYISWGLLIAWLGVLVVSGYSVYMSTPMAQQQVKAYEEKLKEAHETYAKALLDSKNPSCALKAFDENISDVHQLEHFSTTPEVAYRLGLVFYNGEHTQRDYLSAEKYLKYAQEHSVEGAFLDYAIASKLTGITLGEPPCEYVNLFYLYDYYSVGDQVAKDHNCSKTHFYRTLTDLYKREYEFYLINRVNSPAYKKASSEECYYTAIFFENRNFTYGVPFAKEFKCKKLLERYKADIETQEKEDVNRTKSEP